MEIGIYQGASALHALERWQNEVSRNISNSGVTGYKALQTGMHGQLMGGVDSVGFQRQLDHSMVSASSRVNFDQGMLVRTSDPLDVAIQGEGFFEVELPEGGILFTRDGQFHLNEENELVDRQGRTVRATAGALQFLPGGGEIEVTGAGQVLQGGTPVGTLAVTRFADPDQLVRAAGGFVLPPEGDPGMERAEEFQLLQGYLEGSNVSPITEMVNLITVSRNFEAAQKVVSSFDQLLDKTNQTLGNV